MAGEILYQVTAAELKEIKRDPGRVRSYDRKKVSYVDLADVGMALDVTLLYLNDEEDDPGLAAFVSGFKDVGGDECPAWSLSAKQVKEVARALAAISKVTFNEAIDIAMGGCDEDTTDHCLKYFEDLVTFFEEAAQKRRTVVKTIY